LFDGAATMNNRYVSYDEYGLRNLSRHLLRCVKWEALAELLTDLDFIETKCAAGMIYLLVQECNESLKAGPESPTWTGRKRLMDYERFLRSQVHVLRNYPQLVLQLAINQPKDTAPAQDARGCKEAEKKKHPHFEYHCDL
jgi:hypothetical protein